MPAAGPALSRLSAAAARTAVQAGDITVAELVTSQLERIENREPVVKAWAHIDAQAAIDAARKIDAASEPMPLRGVTVGVKDVIDTADMPTQYNSPIYRGHRPAVDADCVARLRAAGALILGKTETTEFAHAQPTRTTNPHNVAHTPGGSSSGSAAAVADFMVATALGTQTGGSTIRPASFCGVYAIKPTFGLIDPTGVKPLSASLDTVGLFGRELADLGLLLSVLSGQGAFAEPVPQSFTVAVCRTGAWQSAEPSVQAAVEAAAAALRNDGIPVREIAQPVSLVDLDRLHQTIMAFETARAFAEEWRHHRAQLSVSFAGFIAQGHRISRTAYDEAVGKAAEARAEFDHGLGADEIILTPSTTGEAPRGFANTGNPVFNRMWTLLHVPCIHLPWRCGQSGLPIGVQIVGRRGADLSALMAATHCRTLLDAADIVEPATRTEEYS